MGRQRNSFQFRNRYEHLWDSVEGNYRTIHSQEFLSVLETLNLDYNMLGNVNYSIPLLRERLNSFHICSEKLLLRLAKEIHLRLIKLLYDARQKGFNAIQVRCNIGAVVKIFYSEEEAIYQALRESTGVAGPASRSSIGALSSIVVDDDTGSSGKCMICLDEFSAGMIVTRMPCPHDFHKECIERWLEETNSCPLCRLSI